MSASDAPENLKALKRAADEGLPDASRPSSGPFNRGDNLGKFLHPSGGALKDLIPDDGPAPTPTPKPPPKVDPVERYLHPGQQTTPAEGTPEDHRGVEGYIDNAE